MKLPIQPGSFRALTTNGGRRSTLGPSSKITMSQALATIPATIAFALARDYATDCVTLNTPECVGTIAAILNDYQRCSASGRTVSCASVAARQIKTVACRSYCGCKKPC